MVEFMKETWQFLLGTPEHVFSHVGLQATYCSVPLHVTPPVVVLGHLLISSHTPLSLTYPLIQAHPEVHVVEFMHGGVGIEQVLSQPDLHAENSSFCPRHRGA